MTDPTRTGPADGAPTIDVVGLIDVDRVVADLVTMVGIPSVNPFAGPASPTAREHELAAWYAAALAELGFDVHVDEVVPGRPNVVGRLRGTGGGASVLLAGHLDTVGVHDYDTAFDATVADGRVHGRGSCDMKAALAAYLEVARVLARSGTRLAGDLVIAGLCDEEHTMIGSRRLGDGTPLADAAIIGEPSNLDVCPAHKGQVCVIVRTHGRAVHSSRPELGRNAIVDMATVIGRLDAYAAELSAREPHPLCGHARVTAAVISGGTIASTVPDRCELEIDRRTLPGETPEQVLTELAVLLDPLVAADPGFRYELVGPTLVCDPLDTPVDAPVVVALLDAVGGRSATAFPAATDAPNLGIPAVVCGPGRLEEAHTTNEYVEIAQLGAAVGIYLSSVLRLTAPARMWT